MMVIKVTIKAMVIKVKLTVIKVKTICAHLVYLKNEEKDPRLTILLHPLHSGVQKERMDSRSELLGCLDSLERGTVEYWNGD